MIYDLTAKMVTGTYQNVILPFTKGAYAGSITIETSPMPAGVIFQFQSLSLCLIGTPSLLEVGQWPISVSFYDSTGSLIAELGKISVLLDVVSAEDLAAGELSPFSLSLGDYYYELLGGPLRQEMRDGV